MNIKKIFGNVALYITALVTLVACGTSGSGGSHIVGDYKDLPNFNKVAKPKNGGTLTLATEKPIAVWNILSSAGTINDYVDVLNNSFRGVYYQTADNKMVLNQDLMESATRINTDPQTIEYKIKQNAVWSDGNPINIDDFKYMWNMMNGRDESIDVATTVGYNNIKSIEAKDGDSKDVIVTFDKPYSEWQGLFGNLYPSKGDWTHPAGAKSEGDTWSNLMTKNPPLNTSNGPYMLKEAKSDGTLMTFEKNPKWYGKEKPHFNKLVFRTITEAQQAFLALQNKELDVLPSQSEVDTVKQLEGMPQSRINYQIAPSTAFELVQLNLKNNNLSDIALRKAIFTIINRDEIIARTEGQVSKETKKANSLVYMPYSGTNYQDHYSSLYGNGNIEQAKKILQDAGYTHIGEAGNLTNKDNKKVDTMRLRYTVGNATRATSTGLIKDALSKLGINVDIITTDQLGKTLSGKDPQHGFDMIIYGIQGIPGLEASGIHDALHTADNTSANYGSYSNPDVDKLLDDALVQTDKAKLASDLNQADQLVANDAYMLPLYVKNSILAFDKSVANVRLGGWTYTANQEFWGKR